MMSADGDQMDFATKLILKADAISSYPFIQGTQGICANTLVSSFFFTFIDRLC